MNRAAIVGVLATLTLGACAGHPAAPTGPSLGPPSAARAGAPAPSPLVTLPLLGRTLELWPFTGFGFGQQSDPVNLVWTGHADPRALRAALLSLDGDRTAFGFPAVFPFNCTWHDEPEVQPEVAYTAASGWVGSPIMLECGTYDQARFHLRFFDVGGVTVGGAPFEVLIPGTLDHQTISWKLAEQFVVVDFLRTGLLDPATPPFTTDPINPPAFGTIPAVIYNGIPTGLRQAIGGPLGDVTDAVPIPSSGHARTECVPLRRGAGDARARRGAHVRGPLREPVPRGGAPERDARRSDHRPAQRGHVRGGRPRNPPGHSHRRGHIDRVLHATHHPAAQRPSPRHVRVRLCRRPGRDHPCDGERALRVIVGPRRRCAGVVPPGPCRGPRPRARCPRRSCTRVTRR